MISQRHIPALPPCVANLTQLSGQLLERGALRRTPAGIPVLEFLLTHRSTQLEAEVERQVECEMSCIAAGTKALALNAANPGDRLHLTGFLASRSLKRRAPVLHVSKIEFIEGTENGFQTQG